MFTKLLTQTDALKCYLSSTLELKSLQFENLWVNALHFCTSLLSYSEQIDVLLVLGLTQLFPSTWVNF